MSQDNAEVPRRSLLALGGAAGVAALAGCTGGPSDANNSTSVPPQRPAGEVDSEHWQYILDSIEYQNAVLQRIEDEVA